jgi:hypothetical protein
MKEKVSGDFWEELFSDMPKPLQEGEITCRMFVERYGCTDNTAKLRLTEKVKAGLLEYIGKRTIKGRAVDAWRRVKKK